jgi:hypothetical protein
VSSSAITGPLLSDVSRSADGSAAAPSWSFQNSPTMGFYRVSANVLGLSTAGVQRMVVDASGNVGIGTASPSAKLDLGVATAVNQTQMVLARQVLPADQSFRFIAKSGSGTAAGAEFFKLGLDYNGTDNAFINFYRGGSTTGGFITFSTDNNTERMRIDASGNLGIGGTPQEKLWVKNGATEVVRDAGTGNSVYFRMHHSGSTIINHQISSNTNYDIVNIGNGVRLVLNGSSWGAISDERKKKNIKPLEYGLAQISAIKPVRFDYKTEETDESSRVGFIAQELLPVVKEAVHGSEDTEYSVTPVDLIPVLVKAIQELAAKVDAQAAEIEALKAK